VIIFLSSKTDEVDEYGNALNNYFIIFGKALSWKEILWHIGQACEHGIVNEQFLEMRKLGRVGLRVNAKNFSKSYPKFDYYFSNGDNTGCLEYARFWIANRGVGMKRAHA
jgi:hypothetical protein